MPRLRCLLPQTRHLHVLEYDEIGPFRIRRRKRNARGRMRCLCIQSPIACGQVGRWRPPCAQELVVDECDACISVFLRSLSMLLPNATRLRALTLSSVSLSHVTPDHWRSVIQALPVSLEALNLSIRVDSNNHTVSSYVSTAVPHLPNLHDLRLSFSSFCDPALFTVLPTWMPTERLRTFHLRLSEECCYVVCAVPFEPLVHCLASILVSSRPVNELQLEVLFAVTHIEEPSLEIFGSLVAPVDHLDRVRTHCARAHPGTPSS